MLSSIVLDALLVIILLMMIPLGFLRGGLREVCTSAGLLFGILLAGQWADRWGAWLSDRLNVTEGSAQFLVAMIIVALATALIGYGGSAAFSYRPGPGGRMYGACIALFNSLILAGFLINTVIDKVYEGTTPEVIERGLVARALSAGFGWVLLLCALGALVATIFGMFVRERPDDVTAYPPATYAPRQPITQQPSPWSASDQARQPEPAPSGQETHVLPAAPVRIREVRHWEDVPEPDTRDTQPGYSKGWRQTWPESKKQGPPLPWEEQPAQRPPTPKRSTGTPRHDDTRPGNPRDVLRDWMKDQGSNKDH